MLLTDRDSRDPLNWLSRILWPDGSTAIEPGESGSPTWWASPSAESPKILIPAQASAARTAVKRYHDGFSPKLRLRSLVAELAMSCEPVAGALLGKKVVSAIDSSSETESAAAVLAGIGELLGSARAISRARQGWVHALDKGKNEATWSLRAIDINGSGSTTHLVAQGRGHPGETVRNQPAPH